MKRFQLFLNKRSLSKMNLDYKSSNVLKKLPSPVLTYKDIPYKAALIFNAGVTKFNGKYVMVFRNDYGSVEEQKLEGTNIGLAYSDDGIHWDVSKKPCFQMQDAEIKRAYDPRLTVIDGRCYMCFAIDTNHGIRGGIAVTDDFENFDVLSMTAPDNRNMVLFPEKIGGTYVRLERPMPVYSRGKDRFDLWLSASPDLRYWGDTKLVMGVEDVPYANDKVGPGAPPIKTEKGWLCAFHAVDKDTTRGKNGWEDKWQKRYTAGIALLDLDDPSKVIGIHKQPLIAPELPFETTDGFRTHVIFPGGMILEPSGEVKLYYGASDTVECLASADVNDLIRLCLNQ
jgi:Predicted glycosylase